MRMAVLARTSLVLVFGLAACQEQPTAPAFEAGSRFSLEEGTEELMVPRVPVAPEEGTISDPYIFDVAARAINPNDYVCTTTSATNWYVGEFNRSLAAERAIVLQLYNLAADLLPTYEALYFQTSDMPQTYGYNGEYTDLMLKTEKDSKRFWDIASADIQMLAMHGTMLQDTLRTAATYRRVWRFPAATAALYARVVRNNVLASQTLNGGNHPWFTFNAFAFSTPTHVIPDKIVMGDGILAGFAALGLGDVAPQAIYAHEFAHHIQYERNYFSDPIATSGDAAERTRYTELMADAFASYYMTHKRGLAMNQKRVEKFLEVFFEIGDCSFTNSGHHGTPNQRMAASRFGFEVANQAKVHGRILTAQQFYQLFVAKYPELIAPDA